MTKRLANPNQLAELRASVLRQEEESRQQGQSQIRICYGASCIASGARRVKQALENAMQRQGLTRRARLCEVGCMGPCSGGPVVAIGDVFYEHVRPEDCNDLVVQHLGKGQPVERLTHKRPDGRHVARTDDIEFFRRQTKVVLSRCGRIDPQRLDDYIGLEGYEALSRVLQAKDPGGVVSELKASGLRGRGGAGFATWKKWDFTRRAEGEEKFVVCNADEGDPGAFMDRSILEGDPHSVIEGMLIAAYVIGAHEGLHLRPSRVSAGGRATEDCAVAGPRAGASGQRHSRFGVRLRPGNPHGFRRVRLRRGDRAVDVDRRATAVSRVPGRRSRRSAASGVDPRCSTTSRPMPTSRRSCCTGAPGMPPTGPRGARGRKSLRWPARSRTRAWSRCPSACRSGDLIYDIGGGIPSGKEFKAAQIGGPSGGCIPKQHLNVPLDYESLAELGAIMGSGGLIVMDEDSCMVDVARFFLEFVQEESCGKCVPCRVGTKRMLEILNRICEGRGEEADVDQLIQLGEMIKETSLCGLGQTASNPVLSTIRHFGHEYIEHIRDKHCRAGVCPSLVYAPCSSACPANVDIPGYVSLVAEKRYAEALRLHRERNPFPAICSRVCFHTCEDKCRRSTLDEPVSIRGVKRFMVDQEVTIQLPEVRENPENARRKIAIIGAGPAGLSCAYFLARLGYQPKIYEAEPRPGGMLVQAIPAYRLPREIVAREVRMIENMGVEILTEKKLGRDFTLKSLRAQGCEAVYLAMGAPLGVGLGVPGENAQGITDALNFLRIYNLRGSARVGRNVVVIGGGNSAIDAARSAVRLGAEQVTVVYRRSREAMPAYKEEIEEALHEGVKLQLLTAPTEVIVENGQAMGIRCQPVRLGEFDRSGRRRPEESGEAFVIPADQILVAIGQSLEAQRFCDETILETRGGGLLVADPVTGQTSHKWIFAGGDAVSGPSSVVEAVAAGERAAVGIDRFLTGREHAFWRELERGRYVLRPRRGAVGCGAREPAADPGRPPAQQLRRSRATVARVGRPAAGHAVLALRLRATMQRRRRNAARQRSSRTRAVI